jgi:hypothetical protein
VAFVLIFSEIRFQTVGYGLLLLPGDKGVVAGPKLYNKARIGLNLCPVPGPVVISTADMGPITFKVINYNYRLHKNV